MPKLATIEAFKIERDLSGGTKISIGAVSCVLSPQQTIDAAVVMLKNAGVGVDINGERIASLPGLSLGRLL